MHYSYKTDTGKIRTQNEDYIALPAESKNLGSLFVLCDGLGGANAGEVASALAAQMLIKEYYSLDKNPDDPGFFITEKIAEINKIILRRSLRNPDLSGMGTTLVSLLITGKYAYCSSVGDSRIYRLRNSHLEQITEDQSLVWELYRNGTMTKEEIRKHPRNNIVTCALGVDSNLLISSVESYQLELMDKDIFLLCSDGLSDMLSDDEIEEILMKNIQLDKKAGQLTDTANNNGGRDNISVILVEI